MYDFDLLVIGAGSGGARASRMAAELGVKVAVVEDGMFGGTCVNVGCVPKKVFAYGGEYALAMRDAQGYGWQVDSPVFDWHTIRHNKDAIVDRINGKIADTLAASGVHVINGRAKITAPHKVQVDNGDTYTAKRILIAVGGTPYLPPIEGIEHASTSYDVFYLDTLPKRAVVVGSGYIAVEFASIFHNMGVKTDLIVRKHTTMRFLDADISAFATAQIQQNGVHMHLHTQVTKIVKTDNGYVCHIDSGEAIETDFVLYAIGRVPNTEKLGLENAGVAVTDKGAIRVNDDFATNVPHIYAIGDVIDRVQLTPVALQEAMTFIHRVYGDKTAVMTYENIPTAIFSTPNVATVGLTEQQAKQQGYTYDIYRTAFSGLKNEMAGSPLKTMIKLVVDKHTDRMLGVHMVGEHAGEIVQGFAVAIKTGATKADFDNTLGIHPTTAEEFVTMRTPVKP